MYLLPESLQYTEDLGGRRGLMRVMEECAQGGSSGLARQLQVHRVIATADVQNSWRRGGELYSRGIPSVHFVWLCLESGKTGFHWLFSSIPATGQGRDLSDRCSLFCSWKQKLIFPLICKLTLPLQVRKKGSFT